MIIAKKFINKKVNYKGKRTSNDFKNNASKKIIGSRLTFLMPFIILLIVLEGSHAVYLQSIYLIP